MDSHMNNMNNMNNGRDSPSSMNNGMYNSVNVVNSPPRSVKDELETDGLDLLANPNNVPSNMRSDEDNSGNGSEFYDEEGDN